MTSPRWTARYVLGIALVALMATGFAIVWRASMRGIWNLAAGAHDVVHAMMAAPWWLAVILPAIGGLVGGSFVKLAARRASSHGVGGVIEAVAIGRIRLSFLSALLRSAASYCAIITGGSLGREGPLIQFGGTAGDDVGEWLSLGTNERRVLIAAGTAAGFATAYNTPIAGVVFVLEVVAGVVVVDTVVPTLIATVIATELTRIVVGEDPLYGLRTFELGSAVELFAYIGVGIACAFVITGFRWLSSAAARCFRKIKTPYRQAVGGLGAGAFVAALPIVAGNGFEPLGQILDGRMALSMIGLVMVAKALATTSSVSSGNPGGVFTPSMLIGGCTGYLVGAGLQAIGVPVSSAGSYALVGMAAAVAASTHAPLMATVLVFELSGDYAEVLPLIIATAISTLVARRLQRDSVYTAELRSRGVTWELTLPPEAVDEPPPEADKPAA